MVKTSDEKQLVLQSNLLFIVGNYGSGKTEVSVNLAFFLRSQNKEVTIADLDLVNPYFRCRESKNAMKAAGIRVVVPPGQQQFADLPIVVPEIKGMLEAETDEQNVAIFDVGGDDVGATVLSSFYDYISTKRYGLLQVINQKRPFTDTVEGCLKMKEDIERTSRLKVTGFVSNAHLMEETTADVVLEGYDLADEVSQKAGVPLEFVAVVEHLVDLSVTERIAAPILPIRRVMLPPWLQAGQKGDRSSAVGHLDEGSTGSTQTVKRVTGP